MKIQSIYENSIALITSLEELNARGIHPSTLCDPKTANMIRQSFAELGLNAEGSIDVETYINGQSVLIFAHISKDNDNISVICKLETFEHVISIAWQLGDVLSSTLLYDKEAYYLAIHTCKEKAPVQLLNEYGIIQPHPKLKYAHLCEHGKIICFKNAIKTIRHHFAQHTAKSIFSASL